MPRGEKNEDLSRVDAQKFMDCWNKNQDVIFRTLFFYSQIACADR